MDLKDQRIAILGGGKSGFCAARLAASRGGSVTAFDSGPPEKLTRAVSEFASIGVELVTGDSALKPEGSFDYAVISPGIDSSWPLAVSLKEVSGELLGEIEFAWRLSEIPIIAITGTNGKTTTTELTAHLLNESGQKAIAAGNYGYAYSDVVYHAETFDWVVLEVSSFQLETISQFHPEIAVWMNFAADHMDRYSDLEQYRRAKLRIFENQTANDVAIIKAGESIDVAAREITFSAFDDGADYGYRDKFIVDSEGEPLLDYSKTRLNGRHNAENVMAAIAAVTAAGVEVGGGLENALSAYTPPSHRCEVVGEKDGVTFVNDSKATNLHALESALLGQDSAVTLIVGGKNKGLNFAELREIIPRTVRTVICIGEIRNEISRCWRDLVPCHLADSLESAVQIAFAEKGDTEVILFSPGTSSFDMFSGYEERGDCFRKEVAKFY